MSLRVAVPAAVLDAVRALTGCATLTAPTSTVGGHSNLSFRTTLEPGGREVVVKSATDDRKRADLRREADLLLRLGEAELGVPFAHVVAHGDHGRVTVTVLDALDGEHGLAAVESGDAPRVAARARVLGRTLRSVHQAAPRPSKDPSTDLAKRAKAEGAAIAELDVSDEHRDAMRAAVASPVLGRGVAFVHGDFGFHNTLWSQTGRGRERLQALLDWEFAGWGNPLGDVAWFWWTLRLRDVDPTVWEAFVAGYTRTALRRLGFDAGSVDALVRAQMVQLLLRTASGSPVRTLWIERWDALDALGPASLEA